MGPKVESNKDVTIRKNYVLGKRVEKIVLVDAINRLGELLKP